jgi:hypothetical protein
MSATTSKVSPARKPLRERLGSPGNIELVSQGRRTRSPGATT